ncbi:MAG: putative lipid II flippase FtsW [Elusimicrobia bacterium]|nr:putative lipid II flippase FtsW [Elusimicrobiota bacterium]
MRRAGRIDYQIVTLSLGLLVFGLVMVYSASAIWADQRYHDSLYFLKRQALWILIGLPIMALLSRLDYNRLKEWIWPLLLLNAVSLLAVLFTSPVGGARRWIRFGPLGFQPAEFTKLILVLFLADYIDRKRSKVDSALKGLAVPWAVMGIFLGLIALEPDLGTPVLIFLIASITLFIGGARARYVLGVIACAVPVLAYEILRYPYRRQRLAHFLQPWSDPRGSGYQIVQSMLAVGSGGWFGRGLGSSQIKLMYLPAPHTDFIFPIIAEELGLLGSLGLPLLFAVLFTRGMRIARTAPNLFGELLASGISVWIVLQAYFNIAMSIGLLPTKGVPLPFFSSGGSSILVTLAGIGILLSISRQCSRTVAIS